MSDYLLDELARVPDALLPGDTRQALAEGLRSGELDNLYRPLGSPEWNVTFSALPPYVDPRMPLAAWVAHWQAGRSPSDAHMVAYRALQRQQRQNGGAR